MGKNYYSNIRQFILQIAVAVLVNAIILNSAALPAKSMPVPEHTTSSLSPNLALSSDYLKKIFHDCSMKDVSVKSLPIKPKTREMDDWINPFAKEATMAVVKAQEERHGYPLSAEERDEIFQWGNKFFGEIVPHLYFDVFYYRNQRGMEALAKAITIMAQAGLKRQAIERLLRNLKKLPRDGVWNSNAAQYLSASFYAVLAAAHMISTGMGIAEVENFFLEIVAESSSDPLKIASSISWVVREGVIDMPAKQGIAREKAQDFLLLEVPRSFAQHNESAIQDVALYWSSIEQSTMADDLARSGFSLDDAWEFIFFELPRHHLQAEDSLPAIGERLGPKTKTDLFTEKRLSNLRKAGVPEQTALDFCIELLKQYGPVVDIDSKIILLLNCGFGFDIVRKILCEEIPERYSLNGTTNYGEYCHEKSERAVALRYLAGLVENGIDFEKARKLVLTLLPERCGGGDKSARLMHRLEKEELVLPGESGKAITELLYMELPLQFGEDAEEVITDFCRVVQGSVFKKMLQRMGEKQHEIRDFVILCLPKYQGKDLAEMTARMAETADYITQPCDDAVVNGVSGKSRLEMIRDKWGIHTRDMVMDVLFKHLPAYQKEETYKNACYTFIELIMQGFIDKLEEEKVPRVLAEAVMREDFPQSYNPAVSVKDILSEPLRYLTIFAFPKHISRIFNLNIKLAEHMASHPDAFDIIQNDPARKDIINEIAGQLNREITLHPAERRLHGDEKNSLFTYLLNRQQNAWRCRRALHLFSEFFRNESGAHAINLADLRRILKYVKIEELKRIFKLIAEDPKLSVTEIEEKIRQSFKEAKEAAEARKEKGVEQGANVEFIVRELKWLISNQFVLEPRLPRLEYIIEQTKVPDTARLQDFFAAIDEAKTLSDLVNIAKHSNNELSDIVWLKIESADNYQAENFFITAFDGIKGEDLSPELGVLSDAFVLLAHKPQSQRRVLMSILLKTERDHLDTLSGRKIFSSPFLRRFAGIISEDIILLQEAMDYGPLKKVRKAVYNLYERKGFSLKDCSEEAQERMVRMSERIALPKEQPMQTQIPHIFFEPLLKLGLGTEAMQHPDFGGGLEKYERIFPLMRQLIMAVNNSVVLNNTTAVSKNRLYQELVLFANHPYRQLVFQSLMKYICEEQPEGILSAENVHELLPRLMRFLFIFRLVLDKNVEKQIPLAETISAQAVHGTFNLESIHRFLDEYGNIKGKVLIERFKDKVDVSAAEESAIIAFAASEKNAWRDHEGRDMCDLVNIYLSHIQEEEHYALMLEALMHWINGDFNEWRYSSKDYQELLERVIAQEIQRMPDDKKQVFAKTAGATSLEKLNAVQDEAFSPLKDKITGLRQWEKDLYYKVEIGGQQYTLAITGDFREMFNIGNYPNSDACQSCVWGNALNRGLLGYTLNSSNKGLILYDGKGNIVARRIIRIKLAAEENDQIKPLIFVEENRQFGKIAEHVDMLYAGLKVLSAGTGMTVDPSIERAVDDSRLQRQGQIKQIELIWLPGRSSWEYSDLWHYDSRRITDEMKSRVKVREKPVPKDGAEELENKYELLRVSKDGDIFVAENQEAKGPGIDTGTQGKGVELGQRPTKKTGAKRFNLDVIGDRIKKEIGGIYLRVVMASLAKGDVPSRGELISAVKTLHDEERQKQPKTGDDDSTAKQRPEDIAAAIVRIIDANRHDSDALAADPIEEKVALELLEISI